MAERGAKLAAFVLGATGEVGREVVNVLAANEAFSRVVIIGRRALELNGEKFSKVENTIVDFDKLDESADKFKGFDVGFCCLGTTKGKAGVEGFIKVDHDYVVESAKLAHQGGTKQFHLVTSQGSDKDSMFLYPKTKGRAEEAVTNLGFERTSIYRPALLLCDRQESRPGEKFLRMIVGSLDRWGKMSVPTITVAQAMVNNALKTPEKAVEIISNAQLFSLAKN